MDGKAGTRGREAAGVQGERPAVGKEQPRTRANPLPTMRPGPRQARPSPCPHPALQTCL